MTDPKTLYALAERCGREGPSFALERNIAIACERPFFKPACYTTSLDAAVTLVPDGWAWLRKSFSTMTCVRMTDDEKEWALHIDGAAKTPALALCAAALRARAAMSEDAP